MSLAEIADVTGFLSIVHDLRVKGYQRKKQLRQIA
jgi:hypothetical protein